jgi:hypothetical protein
MDRRQRGVNNSGGKPDATPGRYFTLLTGTTIPNACATNAH